MSLNFVNHCDLSSKSIEPMFFSSCDDFSTSCKMCGKNWKYSARVKAKHKEAVLMYSCYVELVFYFVAKAILLLCFFSFDIYPYILYYSCIKMTSNFSCAGGVQIHHTSYFPLPNTLWIQVPVSIGFCSTMKYS